MSRLGRWAAPFLGLVVSIALLWEARGLDDLARPGQLGPGFWPRLILIMLGLACAAKLLTGRPLGEAPGAPPAVSRATLAIGIGLILLYVLVAPLLGFPLTTLLFVVAFMTASGARLVPAVGAAAIGTVMLLYVFVRIVYLPLPKGEGPLEAFTLGLYRLLGIF